jgi:ketosteroid isomerase-like protein
MDPAKLQEIEDGLIDAWNRQDVEDVVAWYTDDLVYADPNTRGPVEGADAMRRYLTKLFDRWQMHWDVKEVFPLAGLDGTAARWRASLTSRATGRTAEIDGMDLVLIEDGRVKRNEVYYDRALLAPLLAPAESAPTAA